MIASLGKSQNRLVHTLYGAARGGLRGVKPGVRLFFGVSVRSGPLLCETIGIVALLAPRDGSGFQRYQDGPSQTESLIRARWRS